MSAPFGALFYLYKRTSANRLRAQFARARNPRYLIAVFLGVLYLWWALFRNARLGNSPFGSIINTDILVPIFAALLLVSAARWWVFGSDRSALAFAPAEVQFLFPAPLTRRTLVHAKLLRNQFAILLNSIIWTVLLRGNGGSAEGWRRGIALWLVFSTLSLHRLGASIVRANAVDNEGAGRRRSMLPLLVFGGLIAAVSFGLLSNVELLRAASDRGVRALGGAVIDALATPAPTFALWPVRALIAPVFASQLSAWLQAVPFTVGLLLLHYFWVVRLDRAFEEAALEATQHRAERLHRFRTSQLGKTRSRKGKLARVPGLALAGRPEIAIVWKNVAAAIRGGAWRTQLVSFTIGLAFFAVISRSASAGANDIFIGVAFGWGAMLLFVGPLWMRFDLRLDLQRLEILKTLPLSGRGIVAAEISGVTILHTITVWSLMLVPLVMLLQDPELAVQSGANAALFLAVVLGVPIFNALMFTVQNGTALLFPAWVRLGTEARGFETMGQNLLTTGATTLVVAVALVFPVGAGLLVLWLASGLGDWSYLLATVVAALVVLAELWPVVSWLGTVFEGIDITEVAGNV
ncbi:MAG TPA: putative ABC exporter domain-containing protein [Gemmatimonas sp.]|nr:putative ABC exporter domain-containing protein [Gemmatimonas sp.]